MNTTVNQTETTPVELLVKWVNQRPRLEYANHGDPKSFRSEMRSITNDRSDFFELLSLAQRRVSDINAQLESNLIGTSGRLELKDGRLHYTTGQYFPTEYRPAANNVLRQIIWASYANEKSHETNEPVYKDGIEIRKEIKRNLSRRAFKNYFN